MEAHRGRDRCPAPRGGIRRAAAGPERDALHPGRRHGALRPEARRARLPRDGRHLHRAVPHRRHHHAVHAQRPHLEAQDRLLHRPAHEAQEHAGLRGAGAAARVQRPRGHVPGGVHERAELPLHQRDVRLRVRRQAHPDVGPPAGQCLPARRAGGARQRGPLRAAAAQRPAAHREAARAHRGEAARHPRPSLHGHPLFRLRRVRGRAAQRQHPAPSEQRHSRDEGVARQGGHLALRPGVPQRRGA